MRWSKTLINTLRENPQDAEIVSHRLMLRAGLIRRLAGGLYTFLPLGVRALRKVEAIVREEMDRAGAQEILMPALQPSELWERSGRLDTMGPTMFTVRDRQDRRMILGPTHEEVVTDLAAREIGSYRQLPCTLYQVQVKFRDEIRPRFGLMRAKEFIMKDAYSFDPDAESAEASYRAMYAAYERIFRRCGVKVRVVEADSGDMGGSSSHEFMVLADSGEDGIVECSACAYAANRERAERRLANPAGPAPSPTELPPPEEIDTPGAGTIQAVSTLLECPPERFIKTILYLADGEPVAALVAGDREVNEAKLKRALGAGTLVPADPATILRVTGAPVGFAGPMGLSIPRVADLGLRGSRDAVCGANRDQKHVRNVCLERDARIDAYHDIAVVREGDACPRCAAVLREKRGIEVGHVFKLGAKYTKAFEASFLNEQGASQTMIMGCYGIGVTRALQSVVEQCHDADGICWPVEIAPFPVALLLLDPEDASCRAAAATLEKALCAAGIEPLVDDRKERPGVKFKDADLLGLPLRVVVGARSLAAGGIEIKPRTSREKILVPPAEAAAKISDMLKALTSFSNS